MSRLKTALHAVTAVLIFATVWTALSGMSAAAWPLLGISLITIAWAM